MERPKHDSTESHSWRTAALLFYGVMLVALFIGLYGLFSLYWLAAGTFERSGYNPGSLF
jgi:hypothetical protein